MIADRQLPSPSNNEQIAGDIALARAVVCGDVQAWHTFIGRYSGLLFGVIRRQLFAEDEDDRRGVYVDILEALAKGGLAKYGGRSTLATWLIVFSRNRARDFLRKRHGRDRRPAWFARLDDFQRRVLELYYGESLPLAVVVSQLQWDGHATDTVQVIEALAAIQEIGDERYLNRIGPTSHRSEECLGLTDPLLESLLQLAGDCQETSAGYRPDAGLIAAEQRRLGAQLREAMDRLPTAEQEVLRLRFEAGKTAPQIAQALALDSQRQVYSLIDRGLKRLRDLLPE